MIQLGKFFTYSFTLDDFVTLISICLFLSPSVISVLFGCLSYAVIITGTDLGVIEAIRNLCLLSDHVESILFRLRLDYENTSEDSSSFQVLHDNICECEAILHDISQMLELISNLL